MTDETDTRQLPSPTNRRRGRPKGSPRPAGSGRQKGTPNALGRDLKAEILKRGNPIAFLADIVSGKRVRVGPQAGPGEARYAYPSLSDRLKAAEILSRKVLADLKSEELTGADGAPLIPPHEGSPFDLARSVAFLLTNAAEKDGEAKAKPDSYEVRVNGPTVPRSAPPAPAAPSPPEPPRREEPLFLTRTNAVPGPGAPVPLRNPACPFNDIREGDSLLPDLAGRCRMVLWRDGLWSAQLPDGGAIAGLTQRMPFFWQIERAARDHFKTATNDAAATPERKTP